MSFNIIQLDIGLNFVEYATQLIENSSRENIVFISANRRPLRFVEKDISIEAALKTNFFTIEEFAEHLFTAYTNPAPILQGSVERNIFFLKLIKSSQLYEKLGGNDAAVFPWSKRISVLFNEIDKQLLSEKLRNFQYVEVIYEARVILENLKDLYNRYEKEYKNFSYSGVNFKNAAIITKSNNFKKDYNKTLFIFAGLIYLSNSEKKMIKNISEFCDVEFIVQTDLQDRDKIGSNYSFESFSAAEKTIKLLKKSIKSDIKKIQSIKSQTKFQFYKFPNTHNEAKFAAKKAKEIADGIEDKNSPKNMAIVLPESSTLFPLLSYIGSRNSTLPINITMGYPFGNTDTGLFLEALFNVLMDMERKFDNTKEYAVDSALLLRLLNTNLIGFVRSDIFDISKLKNELLSNGLSVYKFKQESDFFNKILSIFFNAKSFNGLYNAFINLFERFDKDMLTDENNKFTAQMIQFFYTHVVDKLNKLNCDIELDIKLAYHILNELIRDISVPFEGNPLKGVQIMGALEARLLSFDYLFFMDVNEGILPSGDKIDPLLPESIKRELGLASYAQKEELEKYNFFRLAYSSKNCFILYKTANNAIDRSVRSRFVEQLALLHEYKNKEALKVESFSIILPDNPHNENFIEKTQKTQEAFEYNLKSISPTDLNTYMECPYRYYLKKIRSIKQRIKLDKDFEADKVGTLVHKLFEIEFKKYAGQKIDEKKYNTIKNGILKNIEKIPENLKAINKKDISDYVKTLSEFKFNALKVILKYRINRFFAKTASNKTFEVIGIEKRLKNEALHIEGIADRIDKIEEKNKTTIRIVDYKTGSYSMLPLKTKIGELFDGSELKNKDLYSDEVLNLIKTTFKSVQIPAYLIMADSIYENCELEGTLCYIGKTRDTPCKTISTKELSIEHSKAVIEYIENHMKYSDKIYALPGLQCQYCEFSYFCRFAQI